MLLKRNITAGFVAVIFTVVKFKFVLYFFIKYSFGNEIATVCADNLTRPLVNADEDCRF